MTLGRSSEFGEGGAASDARGLAPGTGQLGTGLLLGSAAAILGILPAALRVPEPFALSALGLAGAAAAWLGPVVAAARALRPLPGGLGSVSYGLLLSFGPLVLFAAKLWSATHHRPLGAVTFSLIASGLVLGCVVATAHLRRVGSGPSGEPHRVMRVGLWIACAASLALGASRLPGSLGDAAFRSGLLDALLLLALTVGSTRWDVSAGLNRVFRIAGPVAYTLLVGGAAALLHDSELYAVLQREAPVPLAPLLWL